jgi:flavin-dependent dehydrogenase
MGAYVGQMKARLDEIEVQLEHLGEERRRIVSFLEGFAQLQRIQRDQQVHARAAHAGADLYAVTLTAEVGATHDGRDGGHGSHVVRHVYRAPQGSTAEIGDTVYRLLADGRRRSLQEILLFLEVRGIAAKGTNPAAFLSTLLSRDERFDPSRRDGWGLKGRP